MDVKHPCNKGQEQDKSRPGGFGGQVGARGSCFLEWYQKNFLAIQVQFFSCLVRDLNGSLQRVEPRKTECERRCPILNWIGTYTTTLLY
eukprot:1138763-Pelagomonas_calceolata.AAC.10